MGDLGGASVVEPAFALSAFNEAAVAAALGWWWVRSGQVACAQKPISIAGRREDLAQRGRRADEERHEGAVRELWSVWSARGATRSLLAVTRAC